MDLDRRTVLGAGLAMSAGPALAAGRATGLTALTNEPSRGELFERVKAAAAEEDPSAAQSGTRYFNLYGPFRFPADALYDIVEQKPRQNSVFGVDISHYTASTFPIEQLAQRQVRFLYIKASQGRRLFDPKFAPFYKRAIALPAGQQVHPGAYHFLSSADAGVDQAKTFVKVLGDGGALVGGRMRPTDMPPVVDLEWDIAVKNGPDRWASRKPADILAQTRAFLDAVEQATGRKPMIYTARAWWNERIKSSSLGPLAGYRIWLADYSRTSRASENPPGLAGVNGQIWQFTEGAQMALGFNGAFDANIFKGSVDDFYTQSGVQRFA